MGRQVAQSGGTAAANHSLRTEAAMTLILFPGGRAEIEALPPVAGESRHLVCGYGLAEADLWAAADPEGYVDAMRDAWTARATAGQCPQCGQAAQGRGLTCGGDGCMDWYANVVPVMEAMRLTELRLAHQQPEPVDRGELAVLVASAGFGGAAVFATVWPLGVSAVGLLRAWWG